MLSDRIPYVASVDRPRLSLPGGARVAVWVIVNVEVWRIDRAMPRTVLPPPMGKPLLPDVPNWSWHEYGMRAGFWRHHDALVSRNIPATLALNGRVVETYPRVVTAAKEAGWEFMGHGDVQGPMHSLADQGGDIKRALDSIEASTGARPRSWESPGLTETEETLDLLRAEGVEFLADWVIDDLPQEVSTPHGPIYTIPYSVETNDITVFALQNHPAEEFYRRGCAQFDRLYAEGEHNARVMAISVHPYITGVPHRIGALEALLDHVQSHGNALFMTASEIGDWYKGAAASQGA
ncbi:MAG: polysaccharide deacetylase family protein [Pseudomonadota bacterium]